MTTTALKDVLYRAENWPEAEQQKLVAAARLIEDQMAAGFELRADDWTVIAARVEAARNGGIATDEETAAFFGKLRRA